MSMLVGEGLIAVDIAVKSGLIRVVAIYASNEQTEHFSLFHQFGPFLMNPTRLILMGGLDYQPGPKVRYTAGS